MQNLVERTCTNVVRLLVFQNRREVMKSGPYQDKWCAFDRNLVKVSFLSNSNIFDSYQIISELDSLIDYSGKS